MDEFEVNTEAAADPASEFLEREKEELGDVLGQDDFEAVQEPEIEAEPDTVIPQMEEMRVASPVVPRIEPETIRVWREENEKRLAEKDAKEDEMLKELREQAKKELSDW